MSLLLFQRILNHREFVTIRVNPRNTFEPFTISYYVPSIFSGETALHTEHVYGQEFNELGDFFKYLARIFNRDEFRFAKLPNKSLILGIHTPHLDSTSKAILIAQDGDYYINLSSFVIYLAIKQATGSETTLAATFSQINLVSTFRLFLTTPLEPELEPSGLIFAPIQQAIKRQKLNTL